MPAQTRIIHYYVCLGAAGGKEWKVNMEQLYTLLKNSINEEMGWMIDHIYEDYKDTEDILGFALSCEKILRLYYGADIHEQIRDLLIYVFYVYLDYDEDKIELLLDEYNPEHNRYIQ